MPYLPSAGAPRAAASTSPVLLHARGLSATLDDGRCLYADLDLLLTEGPVALVGANGSGKSTLLRQLAGDLPPGAGRVETRAHVHWLSQHCGPTPARVVDVLGEGDRIDALRRLLAGAGDAADVACVDEAWSLESDLRAALDAAGLGALGLDDAADACSGGERQQLRLLAAIRAPAPVLLLDEPSTFLDGEASRRWRDALLARPGATLVVTHDAAWLAATPRIVELRDGALHWTEGNLEVWRAQREARRRCEAQALAQARVARDRSSRDAAHMRERLDRRSARGRQAGRSENQSPLLLDHRADRADHSRGRAQAGLARQREAADLAVRDAYVAMERLDTPEFVDAAALALPAGRQVLAFEGAHPCAASPRRALDWSCSGPVRIGLTGRNGSGKSTLLRAIAGRGGLAHGEVAAHVPVQSLDQHLAALPGEAAACDWLAQRMPDVAAADIATRLALLGLAGASARQPLGALSGGERMRVAVAAAAWAMPAAPLLLLDEPASHLDFDSVEAMTNLLRAWPGALLVVSHDPAVLDALALTHRLHLDAETLVLE